MSAIERAVRLAGGPAAVARKLGVEPSAVTNWIRRGSIPGERVPALADASGIPRHELRPDLWDAPVAEAR